MPLLLVTPRENFVQSLVDGTRIVDVVWSHDIEACLPTAVMTARATGIRTLVRQAAAQDRRLSPVTRRAIVAATASTQPLRRVADLAVSIGHARSTLWRAWSGDTDGGLRIEDLLDWLLLVEAMSRKQPDTPWAAIADGLGIHEHTLARIAQRLLGLRLRELSIHSHDLLSSDTIRSSLARLLGRQSIDDLL
jgi:hypothetical protein